MKLFKLLTEVGGDILAKVIPGGSVVLDAVNEFLPDGAKLGSNATGSDIQKALSELPPEAYTKLLEREFDVEVQKHQTLQAMLTADATSPHTTRPYIAKGAFHVIAFVTLAAVGAWAYGVLTGDAELVSVVMTGYPFLLSVVGPLVTLLWAYFGVLKTEQKNKLSAATGNPLQGGIATLIGSILKK